jgi:HEAT repeat protein
MDDLNSYTAYYLEKLKGDDWDAAYHSLIEADHATIPILIDAYRTEAEPAIRATLVEIIWQHRVPETISFLSEALYDNHPEVWKNALDGFVALGQPSSIQILESAKQQSQGNKISWSVRIGWIDEAIQQIRNGSFA